MTIKIIEKGKIGKFTKHALIVDVNLNMSKEMLNMVLM